MKPVLLINPNGSQATTDAMLRIARRSLPAVIGWTNRDGPPMITEPEALARAADQVAAADLPPASGVIVAAFGDPGRAALAGRLSVPVVGIGAAAARAGGRHAPFAVATTTPGLEGPIDRLMAVEAGYMGCFFTQGDPEALARDTGALDIALTAAVVRAAQAGARSVIIGGGPLAEAAQRIADAVPVRLIQPLPEACAHLVG